jgi:hypothetical protein
MSGEQAKRAKRAEPAEMPVMGSAEVGRNVKGARPLLPAATVTLGCDECGVIIAELSINTGRLVSELSSHRKDHPCPRLGWQK